MSAYVVFQLTPRDPARIADYTGRAMAALTAAGGKPLAFGPLTALHGQSSFERGALFEFPDRAAAMAWYEGAEYQSLLPLRSEAMDCSVVLVG